MKGCFKSSEFLDNMEFDRKIYGNDLCKSLWKLCINIWMRLKCRNLAVVYDEYMQQKT